MTNTDAAFCERCGSPLDAGAAFCSSCGCAQPEPPSAAVPVDKPPTPTPVPAGASGGVRAVRTSSRSTLIIVVCVALAAAGAGVVLLAAHSATGRPASLGPKVTVSISALLGRSLPHDAQCSAFTSVVANVAVTARCGSLDVVIDDEGGRLNGCTYIMGLTHESPYWECRAETSHIQIESAAFQKSPAEKRLQEAIDLVLRLSQTGR
jgi:hypothetical protein